MPEQKPDAGMPISNEDITKLALSRSLAGKACEHHRQAMQRPAGIVARAASAPSSPARERTRQTDRSARPGIRELVLGAQDGLLVPLGVVTGR